MAKRRLYKICLKSLVFLLHCIKTRQFTDTGPAMRPGMQSLRATVSWSTPAVYFGKSDGYFVLSHVQLKAEDGRGTLKQNCTVGEIPDWLLPRCRFLVVEHENPIGIMTVPLCTVRSNLKVCKSSILPSPLWVAFINKISAPECKISGENLLKC